MLFKGCGVAIHLCSQAVRQVTSISVQEFTDDLRHRLRTVWRDVKELNPQDTNSKFNAKLPTYQSLFAVPFDLNVRALFVCRDIRIWICLNMSCKILPARFRLRAHTLKAKTLLCDCCACEETQDEAHAFLMCRDADVYEKKRKTTQAVKATPHID